MVINLHFYFNLSNSFYQRPKIIFQTFLGVPAFSIECISDVKLTVVVDGSYESRLGFNNLQGFLLLLSLILILLSLLSLNAIILLWQFTVFYYKKVLVVLSVLSLYQCYWQYCQ